MSNLHTDSRLRELFRSAIQNQPAAEGPHVVDDDQLLTCWSEGLLSEGQLSQFVEHLSLCSYCQVELTSLVQAGVLDLPDVGGPAVIPLRPQRRFLMATVGIVAVAAVVLVLFRLDYLSEWFSSGSVEPRQALARAERDLQKNRASSALEQLLKLNASGLSTAERKKARQLMERAGYLTALDNLLAGRVDRVQNVTQELQQRGASSGRVENLHFQAERGIAAEVTLACASAREQAALFAMLPAKGGLPTIDKKNRHLLNRLAESVEAHPKNPILRINYADQLLELGELTKAREQFQRLLSVNEQKETAHLGLGLIALRKKQTLPDALQHFQAGLEINEQNVALQTGAALALEKSNRHQEAREHWQRALGLVTDARLRQMIAARLKAG